jgi:hypothetical protein
MKPSIKVVLCSFFTVMFLAGCSGEGSFQNFKLIGSAKDAKESTIGKNLRMVYQSSGTVDEVCDAQAKLITDANWKISSEPRRESTYKTATYTDDTSYLTLMCSEQDGTTDLKVTLTLEK